jgi:transposase
MTRELEALRDWLKAAGVTHVGMESTGVYWRPIYAVLEGDFELIVGNARHIRNVPGRKTDVKDAEWIADLVRHGLIAKSFVPPPPLRELLRYRRKLVESQAAERNRLLKLLETANIRLASVASDVFGVSGQAMLAAWAGVCPGAATKARASKRADVPAKATFTFAPSWLAQLSVPAARREAT